MLTLVGALFIFGTASTAMAQTANSNNYQMTEMEFGGASGGESCSASYCAQVSLGDSGAANTATSAEFGPVMYDEPLLQVIVEPGESNLGDLSTETTATKTTKIKIRNYLSGGYIVQMIGDPPKIDSHTLSAPSVPTASTPGTEQFAINLAANTSPTVGAAPVQIPSEMIFGAATANYNTPNLFKYTSGDTIAQSDEESGTTEYTVSMIVNISNSTPAGKYYGDFGAFVIPAY